MVTGSNTGLGFAVAAGLAAAGATVVMAVRDLAKGEAARTRILERVPAATVVLHRLDLADLASVGSCAGSVVAELGRVDVLVNNAGLMLVPQRRLTQQGFELQMGVNHLGHFAFTAALLPALLRSPAARIVSVTSIAHRLTGRLDPGLGSVGGYAPMQMYAQSKLACALFGLELDRRARAAGSTLTSVLAHPGYSATELATRQVDPGLLDRVTAVITPYVGSTPEHGAQPELRAATDLTLTGGELVGPRWLVSGRPVLERPARNARNLDDASVLWRRSEELTGVALPLTR